MDPVGSHGSVGKGPTLPERGRRGWALGLVSMALVITTDLVAL